MKLRDVQFDFWTAIVLCALMWVSGFAIGAWFMNRSLEANRTAVGGSE